MAKLNVWKKLLIATSVAPDRTPTQTEASRVDIKNAPAELRRTILKEILWENWPAATGYAPGEDVSELVRSCAPAEVAALAVEARSKLALRRAPLLLVRELAKRKGSGALVAKSLVQIARRADDLTDFVSLYWKGGKQPLSAGAKRGLARAISNLDAYRLAKFDRNSAVKMRDVLFLCHPKPRDAAQAYLWKRLADGTLPPPETWESTLAASRDKKRTWELLLHERKLSLRALLRHLPEMRQAGVSERLIGARLAQLRQRATPFLFLAAARSAPALEEAIGRAMIRSAQSWPKMTGATGLVVDVSRSMDKRRLERSGTPAMEAAAGLAILLRETCRDLQIATFSEKCVDVPLRRGFALHDALERSQPHLGSRLRTALREMRAKPRWLNCTRLILLTDERTAEILPPAWAEFAYVVNVAPAKRGVNYANGWTLIDGWSERVLDYILASEVERNANLVRN